jgi:5-(carboxyamino)imidazole ribonucleotide synthase
MTMVGVLGAGQLGRMLALAGYPLGLHFRFLDPVPQSPIDGLAERLAEDFNQRAALPRFAAGLDVITYEFENVPVEIAEALAEEVPVYPPPQALEASQDRLTEKTLFRRLGLPTAPFAAVQSREDLEQALLQLGYPALLKTRRFGYDGKGQWLLHGPEDLPLAWDALGGVPLLLEGFVRFERELSQLAVRGREGATAFYPLVENHHRQGMLRLSLAPAPALTPALQHLASDYTGRLLGALDYVGVLAVEFFQQGEQLIANEMAPRVHNSGHWTIEGAATSQFENHLRAVLGLPLGSVEVPSPCAMLNLIGTLPESRAVLAVPDTHLHLYGKAPRPGRKLGHVTVRSPAEDLLRARLALLQGILGSDQFREVVSSQ